MLAKVLSEKPGFLGLYAYQMLGFTKVRTTYNSEIATADLMFGLLKSPFAFHPRSKETWLSSSRSFLVNLAAKRQSEEISPHRWWWYLDVLSSLPISLVAGKAKVRENVKI